MAHHRKSQSADRLPVILILSCVIGASVTIALGHFTPIGWDHAGAVGGLGFTFSLAGIYTWYRGARSAEDKIAIAEALAKNQNIPSTLHPEIDPDVCMGSLSCITACPEGDILGIQDGKAVLIDAAACIGHGKCYQECPIGAIKLVFGTSERGVDLPEVNEYFESARPGLHVIGELGGMGLIKNAMRQGLQLSEHFASKLKPPSGDTVNVAIVGAGPAGVATALGLKSKGVSFRILDQEALGGTVFSYPRQKVVMTETLTLPLAGKFGARLISKEQLLEQFTGGLKKAQIEVEAGTKVTGLEGQDGAFSVITNKGPVKAQKVVLACGRRGTPRKMGAKNEDQPKVTYRLIDATQYDGAKVLVVGGGDSALEAAIQLVEQSSATVTLSYRNPDFGKARDANKKKVRELAAASKLGLRLPSQVMEVTKDEAILKCGDATEKLPNDFIIVCIGGELPSEFLNSVGVGLRKYYGSQLGAKDEAEVPKAERGSAKERAELKSQARLAITLFTIGALIVAVLTVVGWRYYILPRADRVHSPFHAFLKPSGRWGHGVGIVSTFFMVSNFALAVRKRYRGLKGRGSIRRWMTFHQFVGLMSPIAICYHAAFQSNNLLATMTALSVGIVVVTGIIGRFIFGLVSDADGSVKEYDEVRARWERYKGRIEPLAEGVKEMASVQSLFLHATSSIQGGSLLGHMMRRPFEWAGARHRLARVRQLFPSKEQALEFEHSYDHLMKLRVHVAFFAALKRFMRVWRIWHVVMAVFLMLMIAAHITVSLYLGYRWIFTR